MKGFIEVTAIEYGTTYTIDGLEETIVLEDKITINIYDIARLQYGVIVVKTSNEGGLNNHLRTKESYEEIKELIKQAQ